MEILVLNQDQILEKICAIQHELKIFNNLLYKLQQQIEEELEYDVILNQLKQAKLSLNLKIEPNFEKINQVYQKISIENVQLEYNCIKQILKNVSYLKQLSETNISNNQFELNSSQNKQINREQFKNLIWFLLEEESEKFQTLQDIHCQNKKNIFDQLFVSYLNYQQKQQQKNVNQDTNSIFVNFTFKPQQNQTESAEQIGDQKPSELSHVKISDILDLGSLPVSLQSDEEYRNKDIDQMFTQNYNYFD